MIFLVGLKIGGYFFKKCFSFALLGKKYEQFWKMTPFKNVSF